MSNERDFGTEFLRGAQSVGLHAVRIPDQGPALRFTTVKPYDLCLASTGGLFHAVELKQTKRLSWPISGLQPHQEAHLKDAVRVGAQAWVIINVRARLSERQAKRWGCEVVNRTFALSVEQVRKARAEDAFTGLALEWLHANAIELPQLALRSPEGIRLAAWDPRPMLGQSSDECPEPALEVPPCPPGPIAEAVQPPSPPEPRRAPSRPSRCDRALSLFAPLDPPLGESA